MRVYILSGQLGAGGVPKVIFNIAKHLQDSVEALRVSYLGGNDHSVERFRDAGITVECLGGRFPNKRHLSNLYESLEQFDPDVIHTHMGGASLLGRTIGKTQEAIVVSTMHNLYQERALRARAIDYPTSFLADGIISVSHAVERSLPRSFGIGAEATVIHNCIDIDHVRERGDETADAVSWMSEIPEGPLVACVARMSEKKGQHHLLRGFEQVLDTVPRAQLALTGWSDHKQTLIQLSRELGISENVHFLGKVPNPYTVYNAADVVAFPSKFEGFSIGMLEAMCFGKPIVATGIGPFREALGPDHAYATPEQPEELAELILRYLSDDEFAEERGRQAEQRVTSQFSGSVGAQKHRELYERLLD